MVAAGWDVLLRCVRRRLLLGFGGACVTGLGHPKVGAAAAAAAADAAAGIGPFRFAQVASVLPSLEHVGKISSIVVVIYVRLPVCHSCANYLRCVKKGRNLKKKKC